MLNCLLNVKRIEIRLNVKAAANDIMVTMVTSHLYLSLPDCKHQWHTDWEQSLSRFVKTTCQILQILWPCMFYF